MKRIFFGLALFSLLALILAACGGGGGTVYFASSSVSGVAAGGAPISGTVTLVDKTGTQRTGTIDINGNFSIDTQDLTPPFILKAVGQVGGQPCTLFSAASSAGTFHITPLTNLILAAAVGGDPSRYFGSAGAPDTSRLQEANLQQARQQVRTLLLPLLQRYGIAEFNPESGSYVANPSNRLDAMLEAIRITVDATGALTITNKLTGAVLATGNVANLAAILLDPANAPGAVILDDLAAVAGRIAALKTLFNLGAALNLQEIAGIFFGDPNYGTSSGQTLAQNIQSIVDVWGAGGLNQNGKLKSIQNVRLVGDLTSGYAGRSVDRVLLVNYDFIFENGTRVQSSNVTFGKESPGGAWKFIGDPSNSPGGNNYGASTQLGGNNYGVTITMESVDIHITLPDDNSGLIVSSQSQVSP